MTLFWYYFRRIMISFVVLIFGVYGSGSLIVKSNNTADFYTYLPIVMTPPCDSYSALTEMTIPPTIQANMPFTITTNLQNTGCSYLGRPVYEIQMQTQQQTLPRTIASVVNSLSVEPGGSDVAELSATITNTGQITLTAVTSFEIHYDVDPPVWGSSQSQPATIMVTP